MFNDTGSIVVASDELDLGGVVNLNSGASITGPSSTTLGIYGTTTVNAGAAINGPSMFNGSGQFVVNTSLSVPNMHVNTVSGTGNLTVTADLNSVSLGGPGTVTVNSGARFEAINMTISGGTFNDWGVGVINSGSLTVGSGATFQVESGAVIKALNASIDVQGTLVSSGTSGSPAIFTSLNDNSVGGVTGSGHPIAGDWYGITVSGSGATANLNGVLIEYAATALNVPNGTAAVRGTVTNNTKDVVACDWGGNCSVDASNVYWGSSQGPPAASFGCGSIVDTPFDSAPGVQATAGTNIFTAGNCSGAPTPDVQAAQAENSFNTSISIENALCGTESNVSPPTPSDQQRCYNDVKARKACFAAAIKVAGQGMGNFAGLGVSDVVAGIAALIAPVCPIVATALYLADFVYQIYGVVSLAEALAQAAQAC